MRSRLNRRDFLKLISLLPLARVASTPAVGKAAARPPGQETMPNVLILLFDTLSAKHMSLHGYERETTPNLARFAERATVYHAHYAAGNFTTPGTASILTGTYPWSHRAFHLFGTVAKRYVERNLFSLFGSAPYHRMAYTHNPLVTILLNQFDAYLDVLKKAEELFLFNENVISERVSADEFFVALSSEMGLFHGRGGKDARPIPSSLFLSMFHRMWRAAQRKNLGQAYAGSFPRGLPSTKGNSILFTLEQAIDWIKLQLGNSPQPFLAYFHLLPPHDPYTPRREFVGLFDDGWTPRAKAPHFFSEGHSEESLNQQRREYDEYLAYADAEFGRLYDFMARTGLLEKTYLVLTSDHGEMFERGIWAHLTETLYEPVIRVPLLISRPGQWQREDVYAPTSCVDLLPTLLHTTGRAIPDWCEGEILPTFGGKQARSDRGVFVVEAKSNPKLAPLTKGTVAMIKGQYKLIHYFGYDGYESEYELYNLANDPEEMGDLYLSKKSVAAELQSELEKKLGEVNQPHLGQ